MIGAKGKSIDYARDGEWVLSLPAGKPFILLPKHVEPALLARRLAASDVDVGSTEATNLEIGANALEIFSKPKYAEAVGKNASR